MSISSWKNEFYQGRVSKAAASLNGALEHSIRKWTGLSAANLVKHGLIKDPMQQDMIVNPATGASFEVSADQCALCAYDSRVSNWACDACPLKHVDARCAKFDSPYTHWTETGDTKRMIAALKKAQKHVAKHSGAYPQ